MSQTDRRLPARVQRVLKRYADGERNFAGIDLHGVNLPGVNLRGICLAGANLSGAKFDSAVLEGADLRQADLGGATLSFANLTNAILSEANFTSAELRGARLDGAHLINAGLSDADLVGASLRDADLTGAYLQHSWLCEANLSKSALDDADLTGADLTKANLRYASLFGTDLSEVMLVEADLSHACLDHARLFMANLSGADLTHARLVDAYLSSAILIDTDLHGADGAGAILAGTSLSGVDVSCFCEARPAVKHEGPSVIDHTAIVRSIAAPHLDLFLQQIGVPEAFATYLIDCAKAVQGSVFHLFRSTFISYGHPDESFARKLYEALHRNGVAVFFFPEHARPGEKLHRTMRRGIAEHDRVILVCSKASLNREGVLFEIDEGLAREAQMKGETLLIPIRLDRYVLKDWAPKNPDLAQAIRDRVVADFEGADRDEKKFQRGLRQLIAALKK